MTVLCCTCVLDTESLVGTTGVIRTVAVLHDEERETRTASFELVEGIRTPVAEKGGTEKDERPNSVFPAHSRVDTLGHGLYIHPKTS